MKDKKQIQALMKKINVDLIDIPAEIRKEKTHYTLVFPDKFKIVKIYTEK